MKNLNVLNSCVFILSAGTIFGNPVSPEIHNLKQQRQLLVQPREILAETPLAIQVKAVDTLVSELFQVWDDSAKKWLDYENLTHYYDADQNNIRDINEVDHGFSGTMANEKRNDFSYDVNGDLVKQIDFDWDGSIWGTSTQTITTYNASGLPTVALKFYWNGSSFDTTGKTITTYIGTAVSKVLDQSWQMSGFADSKQTITTNTGGKRYATSQFWNTTAWENTKRKVTSFGAKYVSSVVNHTWVNGAWTNIDSVAYKVKDPGILEEVEIFAWDDSTKTYGKDFIVTWSYTGLRNTLIEQKIWNKTAYENYLQIKNVYGLLVGIQKNNKSLSKNRKLSQSRLGEVWLNGRGTDLFDLRGKVMPQGRTIPIK